MFEHPNFSHQRTLLLSAPLCLELAWSRPDEIPSQKEVRSCRFCRCPLSDARPEFSNNVPPGLHYLPHLDPRSEEFVELFRTFLSSKDERTNILALAEPDAKLFIELIDTVRFRMFFGACLAFIPGYEGVPSFTIG